MQIERHNITGLILAGGKARRMGGDDKGLLMLGNKAMIEYIIERLQPQTATLIINANRNHALYARYGLPIIADQLADFCGPLAGMNSALQSIKTDYMITAPCDSPFISLDLVQRLADALRDQDAEISVAHNGERIQPVFCLLKKSLQSSLNAYLDSGERKIDRWFKQHHYVTVNFSDEIQMFDNINTPTDKQQALTRLSDNEY